MIQKTYACIFLVLTELCEFFVLTLERNGVISFFSGNVSYISKQLRHPKLVYVLSSLRRNDYLRFSFKSLIRLTHYLFFIVAYHIWANCCNWLN